MLALAALYEVARRAGAAPIAPSLELRALLALLFERSDGDRAPYAAFWRVCQEPHPGDQGGGYLRSSYSRTEWLRITRGLGIEPQAMTFNEAIQELIRRQGAPANPEERGRRLMIQAASEAKYEREVIATKGHPHSKRGRELAPKIIDRLR